MEPTLTIRRVPLDSLHLDPANAREHGPENLEAIVGSLRRFNQAEPLVVQAKTGRVIGGNGRLVAMKQLGWAECDIVEVDLDDLNATALGIALNRSASLASWNDSTLAKLLEELKVNDALEGVGYSNQTRTLDGSLTSSSSSREAAQVQILTRFPNPLKKPSLAQGIFGL